MKTLTGLLLVLVLILSPVFTTSAMASPALDEGWKLAIFRQLSIQQEWACGGQCTWIPFYGWVVFDEYEWDAYATDMYYRTMTEGYGFCDIHYIALEVDEYEVAIHDPVTDVVYVMHDYDDEVRTFCRAVSYDMISYTGAWRPAMWWIEHPN
jgi:hypothetical protein